MNKCKQCGSSFTYNDEKGYARDLCGPFCEGVYSQKHTLEWLRAKLKEAEVEIAQLKERKESNRYARSSGQ